MRVKHSLAFESKSSWLWLWPFALVMTLSVAAWLPTQSFRELSIVMAMAAFVRELPFGQFLVGTLAQWHLPWGIGLDKLTHFFFYGLMATLIYRCFENRTFRDYPARGFLIALFLACALGVFEELQQGLSGVRHAELADLAADMLGAFSALCAYRCIEPYRRVLEHSVIK